jgi:hypothetical protein
VGDPETGVTEEHFKPLSQGSIYYQRWWSNGMLTNARLGIARDPGEFIFGLDTRLPITARLSMLSSFTYILPSASGGLAGASEETWNVSIGLEFVPGASRCRPYGFSPLFPLADNGSFALRRKQ